MKIQTIRNITQHTDPWGISTGLQLRAMQAGWRFSSRLDSAACTIETARTGNIGGRASVYFLGRPLWEKAVFLSSCLPRESGCLPSMGEVSACASGAPPRRPAHLGGVPNCQTGTFNCFPLSSLSLLQQNWQPQLCQMSVVKKPKR